MQHAVFAVENDLNLMAGQVRAGGDGVGSPMAAPVLLGLDGGDVNGARVFLLDFAVVQPRLRAEDQFGDGVGEMGRVGKADISFQNLHFTARSGHNQVADMGARAGFARRGDEKQMHRLGDDFAGQGADIRAVLKERGVQGGENNRPVAGDSGQMRFQFRGGPASAARRLPASKPPSGAGKEESPAQKWPSTKTNRQLSRPKVNGAISAGVINWRAGGLGRMERQLQQRGEPGEAPFFMLVGGKAEFCGLSERVLPTLFEPGRDRDRPCRGKAASTSARLEDRTGIDARLRARRAAPGGGVWSEQAVVRWRRPGGGLLRVPNRSRALPVPGPVPCRRT